MHPAQLARLQNDPRYRFLRTVEGTRDGIHLRLEGRELIAFCSNDYLGLAHHPQVVQALQRGAARHGVGSGAAHLVSGHHKAHAALEAELADFLGRPKALLFSTGYMANLGVLSALAGRGDRIWEDRLNHASLIDGARLSGARLHRYPHGDLANLRARLAASGARLIATDGLFSMDGGLAPLPELAALAQQAGAQLLVDDAHGIGVLGEGGRGSLEHWGLDGQAVPILVGTLGKAFGTFGAFVAGSEELIETLVQRARTYLYTTAPPPALAEATRMSLKLVRREGWRRQRLQTLIQRFRQGVESLGLPLLPSQTPIQPIVAGSAQRALAWSQALEARGIWVVPIRPPTVPEGSARLRITLSAAHEDEDLERLLNALAALKPEAGP